MGIIMNDDCKCSGNKGDASITVWDTTHTYKLKPEPLLKLRYFVLNTSIRSGS